MRPAVDDGEEGGREAAAGAGACAGSGWPARAPRRATPCPTRAPRRSSAPSRSVAATSRPLPLTSPTSTRDRAAGQRPDAEHVAAAGLVGDRLVDQPELEPGLRVGRPGDEAGGQRAGDPPLVLELERVGDRAGGADAERREPPQVVLAEAAGHLVGRAQHAEQPAAERDRHVHERADALRLDHPADEALGVRRATRRRAARRPRRARACPRRAGSARSRGARSRRAPATWRSSAWPRVVAGEQHHGGAGQLAPPGRRSRGRRRRGRSRRRPPAARG